MTIVIVPARDLNLLAVESTVETTISMLRNRGQSSMALPLIGSASDTINMLGNEDDEVIPFRRKMIVHIESLLVRHCIIDSQCPLIDCIFEV